MHVCECVCLNGGCVVFVCVPDHACIVITNVCLDVCLFVNVCDCLEIVLCLYVSFAMFVL